MNRTDSPRSGSRLFYALMFLFFVGILFATTLKNAPRQGQPLRPTFVAPVICAAIWLAAVFVYWVAKRNGLILIRVGDAVPRNGDDKPQPRGEPSSSSTAAGCLIVATIAVLVAATQFLPPKNALVAGTLSVPPVLFLLFAAYLYVKTRSSAEWICRLNEGDGEAVVRDLEEEIRQKGATAERLNNLGVALLNVRRHEDALDALDGAAELDPQLLTLSCNRALALWRVGRIDEALPLFAEFRRQHPQEFIGANNYARLLAELNRIEEAREQYREAERLFNVQRRRFPRSQIIYIENELAETREACRIETPDPAG